MGVNRPSLADSRGFDVLLGTPLGPYKTSNLKFLAKLGICKYIHVLVSRDIAFSCNIAAKALSGLQVDPWTCLLG